MSKEQVTVNLKYEGPDVDDGTMLVDDVVRALQGFAAAYGKVAKMHDPNSMHRLKITGVRSGSVDIVLDVFRFISNNPTEVFASSNIAIIYVIKKILDVIKIKKHTKGDKYTIKGDGNIVNSNVLIVNSDNESLATDTDTHKLLESKLLDKDLDRITSPLCDGGIHSAEIQVTSKDKVLQENINFSERMYFINDVKEVVSTKEEWIEVQINSLTQSTNNGFLYLGNGNRVPYRYKGEIPQKLNSAFGAHYRQSIRAQCVAHMDENLEIIRVDIYDIEPIQPNLFPESEEKEDAG